MDNKKQVLIEIFLNLEKFVSKKTNYDYLSYIRYNNELKRCEAFDRYGILKIYPIEDLNESSFLFKYDKKTKELIKIVDNIFFPTSLFSYSTDKPILMDNIKNIKKALDHIKNTKTKKIDIKTENPKITVGRLALRKILKDIKEDTLSIKINGNILIINNKYFIHADIFN